MDFEPLSPSPGTQSSPDMALTLTSAPNSYGGKLSPITKYHIDQGSESGRLFNSKTLGESDTANLSLKFKLPVPGNTETTNGSGSAESGMESSDSISSASPPGKEEEEEEVNEEEEESSVKDDEPVDCANCDSGYPSLQSYMDHKCAGTDQSPFRNRTSLDRTNLTNTSNNVDDDFSDGESFDGKIVYNSDGSAYIIEGGDSDLSDLDSIIDLPHQDGIIIDRKGSDIQSQVSAFPYVANAFFVPRNPASVLNSIYSAPSSHPYPHQAPMMFSYRVYDVRSGKTKTDKADSDMDGSATADRLSTSDASKGWTSVPTKPILMCFICKLSFGYAKSFTAHAETEHSMTLNSEEVTIMSQKNSSAIIQCVGKEKEPLMSFLEPKPGKSLPTNDAHSPSAKPSSQELFSPTNMLCSSYPGSLKDTTSVSFVYSKPKLSDNLIANSSPLMMQLKSEKLHDPSTQGLSDSKRSEVAAGSAKSGVNHGAMLDCVGVHNQGTKYNNSVCNLSETSGIPDHSGGSDYDLETSSVKDVPPQNENVFQSPNNHRQSLDMSSSSASYTVPSLTMSLPMATSHPSSSVFLGVCEDHPQGRAQGVECPKCDMILSSSQSLGGHMTMMHSRNSCKTLKCPKCNWHYKYQETLEIHMKEKHPDNDQQCIYCMTNQSHPRLARGESYSCGYKPYRCEVCNYSTTTKGNLSIHMQSDKHLNNVQELANGGEVKMPPQQPVQTEAAVQQMKKNKPKPTWKCDVCNYETNVARNLRIHMTSEKHTHNMMVLQQNMKHMQRDMQIQQLNQLMLLQNDPSFLAGMSSPMTSQGNIPFGYDQSMMMANMQGPYGEIPMDLRKENGGMGVAFDPQTPDAARMYSCCVCNTYATDSLESLHQHLQLDRTKQREQENISVSQGTYMCSLCTYKTNLKANFQLHCKTDKHLQRLQLVNHIKEGGASNEWRLKYLNVSNPVQVRCNSCDYYTNSIHKLQIHTGNPRHESNAQLFVHLQMCETKLNAKSKYYYCSLCKFSTRAKLNLIQHVRSLRHLRSEGIKQMQMKEDGQVDIDPGEIYMVKEYDEGKDKILFDDEDGEGEGDETRAVVQENELQDRKADTPGLYNNNNNNNNPTTKSITVNTTSTPESGNTEGGEEHIHVCPYCDYSSVNEVRIQAHIFSQHSQQPKEICCPLCQEEFKEKSRLEKHLTSMHNVKPEGLHRLLLMVDKGDWIMPPTNAIGHSSVIPQIPIDESEEINMEALEAEAAKIAAEDAIDTTAGADKNSEDDQYRCQTCSKTFGNIDALYAHQNELGHLELKQTPRGPGYLCWKKGCNQYFKTATALQVHFREIHAKRQPGTGLENQVYRYRCNQCSLAFKSQEKLQLHQQYHLIRAATRCSYCAHSFCSIAALRKHIETDHTELSEAEREQHSVVLNESSAALTNLLQTSRLEKVLSGGCPSSPAEGTGVLTSEESPDMATDCTKTDVNSNETGEKGIVKPELMDTNSNEGLNLSMDNGDENSASSPESGTKEDGTDVNYKEQQFLEDYINSQAIAEGSYEDPSRKYKCHRCKLAFTKQNYLTAHNKTLLHRRGDKLSYPMEKYLDPNRPYKCDVCKESFTQKNILLVHYNSVSHLHKHRQVLQQGGLTSSASSQSPQLPTSHSQTPQPSQTPTETTTVSSDPSSPSNPTSVSPVSTESDKSKPYKCNICKASYSQGSTLDIHIRSVAHQTKASKLQELVLTGQVDLSQPLIEQPNDKNISPQHQKKILAEILQQQPLMSASSSQPLIFPGITAGISGITTGLPPMSLLPGLHHVVTTTAQNGSLLESVSSQQSSSAKSSSNENSTSSSSNHQNNCQESLPSHIKKESGLSIKKDPESSDSITSVPFSVQSQQHQQLVMQSYLSQQGPNSGPLAITSQSQAAIMRPRNFASRLKTQVQRNLLENIGFECVMHFNEFNQRTKPGVKPDEEEVEGEKKEREMEVDQDEIVAVKAEKEEEGTEAYLSDLPELNKCVCSTCLKEFSSVWVLKAHQEEVHKEVVPIDMIEDFGEKFRCDLEKKQPKDSEIVSNSTAQAEMSNGQQSSEASNDNNSSQEMPPPPPPPPQMSPHMDLSSVMPMHMPFAMAMNMPFAMAMNMQPPLMPMMFPMGTEKMVSPTTSQAENNLQQLQKQQQLAQHAAAMQNQKRARTRINDEQLKILRKHFDINNSPSEEQILKMSEQSGLPTKVIKHWFRNTLFKERQRNKDSPYNFNNPPSTTLDLEEYEKTGKLPMMEDKLLEDDVVIKKEDEEDMPVPMETKISALDVTPIIPNPLPVVPEVKSEPRNVEPPRPQTPDMSDSGESMISMSGAPSMTSTPTPNTFILPPIAPCNTEEIRPRFESSPSYSKRANRTRFSDYQVKVLQEYFEQNAYPKDDELDHLSNMLNLSPRVIVVWFQNARQKARKIYENQPPSGGDSSQENQVSPYNRTPGLNYQCKKCSAVFQRYYDLIRHQKKSCTSDSIAEKSQTSVSVTEEDSDSWSTLSQDDANQSESGSANSLEHSADRDSEGIKYKCEKCLLSFERFDLWQEHQNVHTMNPSLFSDLQSNSAFGVLQSMAAAQQQETKNVLKRKLEEEREEDMYDQPRDKRLRTTILPEQLDYLYQKYQVDCNPSRKQLENISKDVGLKKRVVQVWFQNTRARERKGQYRAHQQLIHKRCPFCRALFRAKSALESHLATKHPEEMAKGEINIDSIPDAAIESPGGSQLSPGSLMSPSTNSVELNRLMSPPRMQPFLPIIPPTSMPMGMNSLGDPLQLSMKQFYEDSYKKYMAELSTTGRQKETSNTTPTESVPTSTKHETSSSSSSSHPRVNSSASDYEAPLDLSKPLRVNIDMEKSSDGASTDLSDRSTEGFSSSRRSDDMFSSKHSISDSLSSNKDLSKSSSPSVERSSHLTPPMGKRYRTQMTSVQVRIMKQVFVDYKTPTMAECEMLGREIGLPKRVVQVWFQNARAKEKKHKLTMANSYSNVDFHKPPEECSLCKFKYSHKYTIQDHIFTKKHIEKVKGFIQNQSDTERDITSQSAIPDPMRQQRDMERMRKAWDEATVAAASQPHLSQLQAMGLNALGLPSASMSGFSGSFLPNDLMPDVKKLEQKKSIEKSTEKREGEKRTPVKKESTSTSDVQMSLANLSAHLMSPMAGMLPGFDPSMMPYMYPGLPSYLPGMGIPFLQPGLIPGADPLLPYDPLTFGTPLPLLQIPHQAIKDVGVKLMEPKATIAQYTQDCKSISSLRSLVRSVDYSCARESTVDVGYICKKCQMVYPAKEACVTHQRTICFPGGKYPDNVNPMLKLEQIQYECRLCTDTFSTVQEYKSHCQLDSHMAKTARLQQKSSSSSTPTQPSVVKSVDSVLSTEKHITRPLSTKSPSSSNNLSPSPLPKADASLNISGSNSVVDDIAEETSNKTE
ncbi:zinc finger homeobox protein 4-like [Ylistrum balloti]|uniref:zinc finger homeobox protein 4-like n=1 Tax=Ylistrum balloti TaxID=509963 RepID=UPI002905D109|nr:zinc finger homeobox protein 4-like [Ylistrum balloti]